MADDRENRKITSGVSVTRTKQIERDLLGRVTGERKQIAVTIDTSVPNEIMNAAKAISNAAPKIAAGAQTAGKAIKGRVTARLSAPGGKKKR